MHQLNGETQMRKLLRIAAATAALVGMSTGAANAQLYLEASAGVTTKDSLEWKGSDYDMDDGWNAAVAVGTTMWTNWDVEAEFSYDEMEYSCCTPNNTHEYRLMANATRNCALGGFTPYVGGGIGAAWVTYEYGGGESEADVTAAYQLIGGLRVPLGDRFSIYGEYRYQDLFADAEGDGDEWEHSGNNFALGARMTLN
jgi:OOP family OmpA-OmpF porin